MKKFISFLATLALVFSISSICVHAFSVPEGSKGCSLKTNQTSNYSDYVVGTQKYYGGYNYNSSEHKLTFSAQCFDASSNSFITDKKQSMDIGSSFMDAPTSKFIAQTSWRVHLAPYGIYTDGCAGLGYIWHE